MTDEPKQKTCPYCGSPEDLVKRMRILPEDVAIIIFMSPLVALLLFALGGFETERLYIDTRDGSGNYAIFQEYSWGRDKFIFGCDDLDSCKAKRAEARDLLFWTEEAGE